MAEENNKREEYIIKIGPLLRQALDLQREKIKEATWGVHNASDYIAGEILAKKLLGLN